MARSPLLLLCPLLVLAVPVGASAQVYSEDFGTPDGPGPRCVWDREIDDQGGRWGNRACNRTNNALFPEYDNPAGFHCPDAPDTLPPLSSNDTYCAGALDPVDPNNCVLQVAWEPYCFSAGGYRSELSEMRDAPLDPQLVIEDVGAAPGEPPWRGLRANHDTWLSYRFFVHDTTVDMMANLPLDLTEAERPGLGNRRGPTWLVLHQFHYFDAPRECGFAGYDHGAGPLAALLWSKHPGINGGASQVRVQSRDRTDEQHSGRLLDQTGFEAGEWHTVVMHIAWSGAAADDPETGLIETWIDGVKLAVDDGPGADGVFRLPTQQSRCRHMMRIGQYVLGLKGREVQDVGAFRSDVSFDDLRIGHTAGSVGVRGEVPMLTPRRSISVR